jgi:glucan phosphoethanolaminetransferase (alkaline phosphatase superfamily)
MKSINIDLGRCALWFMVIYGIVLSKSLALLMYKKEAVVDEFSMIFLGIIIVFTIVFACLLIRKKQKQVII